ncbi:uroporphyrinogen-III synthase [Pseudooceanicola sp.]|uniref:uroporphyrinogen-III synthase n=1 Tax=Pseudooceanicola sp. TaxID=1914328 RepID=UPI003516DA99
MTPTVLLTRPAPDSAAFAAALTERIAVPVVVSPLMRIVTDGTLPNMDDVDGVIFTSRNGVRAYRELNGPARPCYCVGPGTAEEARAAGMPARFAEGDAVALEALIRSEAPEGRWLHLHGRHVRVDVSARLREAGIAAEGRVVYAQEAQPLSAEARALLAGEAPVVAPVFSPRSAKLLAQGEKSAAPVYIVAMSDAVASALGDWPRTKCTIAGQMDFRSMLEATVESIELAARVEGGRTPK